jgi:hypothetical protein
MRDTILALYFEERGVCMYDNHLPLVYEHGGLSALIRQGADWCQIDVILENARAERGITSEEEDIAYEAYVKAEMTKHGRIIRLPHEKFQAALDNCLYTFKSNLVITPSKIYFRGLEDDQRLIRDKFSCREEYDDIWLIDGNIKEILEFFRKITS